MHKEEALKLIKTDTKSEELGMRTAFAPLGKAPLLLKYSYYIINQYCVY